MALGLGACARPPSSDADPKDDGSEDQTDEATEPGSDSETEGSDSDPGTDSETEGSDSDPGTETEPDSDTEATAGPAAFWEPVLCAGGGVIESADYFLTACTCPVDVVAQTEDTPTYLWQAGPIPFLDGP